MILDAKVPIMAAIDLAESAGMTSEMVRAATLLNHSLGWANEEYGVVDHALRRAPVRRPRHGARGRRR
jgi:hypothetical protein